MSERKMCRVCLVTFAAASLDKSGRCSSCGDAKAATDAGMTYGKYIGLKHENSKPYERVLEALQKRKYCLYCRGLVPKEKRHGDFCCKQCRSTYEREQEKEREAMEKLTQAEHRACVVCGRPRGRGTKYCSAECRRAAAIKGEAERPERFCPVCGKAVESENIRKQYCSAECQKKAARQRAKERKHGKYILSTPCDF